MKYLILLVITYILTSCYSQRINKNNECNSKSTNDSLAIVYKNKEALAKFPGGDYELEKFIKGNLEHISYTLEDTFNRVIYVKLKISKEGTISFFKIIRNIPGCDSCENIAKDIIKKMPQWEPAFILETNGTKKFIDSERILPVKF